MAEKLTTTLTAGIWKRIPPFRLVLGLCPALAVTMSAENGLGMGLATAFVLILSNGAISALREVIPSKVRIASYIVIIATLVSIVEILMKAYFFPLSEQLGIYIPLIVVNCIVLGRAEGVCFQKSATGLDDRRFKHRPWLCAVPHPHRFSP